MFSEVRVQKSRPVEPGARLYKHLCGSDCFGYKSWLDGWMLMTLTYKIDIYETKKLTKGQVHTVEGQSQKCKFVKNLLRLYIMKNDWILMTFTYMSTIDEMLKFTFDQGQKVKDLGQICNFEKKWNRFDLIILTKDWI